MHKDILNRWSLRPTLIVGILFSVFLLTLFTPALAQDAYVWKIFGELEHGRQQFTASWLGEDRLLVIGGKIDGIGQLVGNPTTSCEIINLRSASVVPAGSMTVPRAEHVSLVDERDSSVIVIGGVTTSDFDGEVTNVIERYNPVLDEWSVIGSSAVRRRQHTAYWISPTEILIVGGRRKDLTSLAHAEIFDLRSKTSRRIADFPFALNSLQSITEGDYNGVVFGGRSGGANSERSPKGFRYDETSNSWVEVFDLGVSLSAPTVVGTWNGPAVVSGGAISEKPFDAVGDTWLVENGLPVRIGEMQNGRQWHSMAQLNTDTVIAGGGYDDGIKIVPTCDWIDVTSGIVRPGPPLNVERSYPVFASIPTHFNAGVPTTAMVLAIGGLRDDGVLDPRIEILVRDCSGELNLLSESVPKNYRGVAYPTDTALVLTDTATFVGGAVWVRRKVDVYPDLEVNFAFRLSGGNDHDLPDAGPPGADGIALVIQNVVPSGVGDVGRGIGYDGISHGVAIEFDSYANPVFSDPATSHVAIQVGDGQKLSASHRPENTLAVVTDGVPEFRADGTIYYAKVQYTGGRLTVFVDTQQNLVTPVTAVDIDLSEVLGLEDEGRAWVGLTAATGFSSQRHEILGWDLGTCDPLIVGVANEPAPLSAPSLRIVPSPADQQAVVTLPASLVGGWELRVVSMDGRTLYTTSGADATSTPVLPAAQFAPGMYAVVITTGQRAWTTMWSVIR